MTCRGDLGADGDAVCDGDWRDKGGLRQELAGPGARPAQIRRRGDARPPRKGPAGAQDTRLRVNQ